MRILLLTICIVGTLSLTAQTTIGLVAHYPFDSTFNDATGNTTNTGLPSGAMGFACGAVDRYIAFVGGDLINILGDVTEEFDTEDFTISFYFKSTSDDGIQYLLSKRSQICNNNNVFYIRYRPSTRNINVYFAETPIKSINLVGSLPTNTCWYHVVLVRDAAKLRLYVNGKIIAEQGTVGRADIKNSGKLLLGGSYCYGPSETPFRGRLDELRIYNRALKDAEARGLYAIQPDKITNRDTIVFLGAPVPIKLSGTCANAFSWAPLDGVFLPDVGATSIVPSAAGTFTYTLSFSDPASTCKASDSIRITVVDPRTLTCDQVLLPNTFTPNNDGINEVFGISNPYAIGELYLFEIFDRWGGRMFVTTSPFAEWDGTYQGQPVNPGVYWYKIIHICNGERKLVTGSVLVMK